ncbi:MAG TPA: hypothetical protein VJ302_16740 [Blastocatellia bacterium]|nr:hypothetical protein [Blastocatellia bacterium]
MGNNDSEGSMGPIIFMTLGLTGWLWFLAEAYFGPKSIVVKIILTVGGILAALMVSARIWGPILGRVLSLRHNSKIPEVIADQDQLGLLRTHMVESGTMTCENADHLITLAAAQSLFSASQEEVDIVSEYGKLLEDESGPLRPISELPYPKETIRLAIENLLVRVQDPVYSRSLRMGLFCLDNFIPDEEVPRDPDENQRKWMMLRFGYGNSQQNNKGTV